jgi:hypothetical protein
VALHALAIDEHRRPFEAGVWRRNKFKYSVPRRKLWVIQGMLVGSASPDGTVNCAMATRIAVKSCACGAPLRGCGT